MPRREIQDYFTVVTRSAFRGYARRIFPPMQRHDSPLLVINRPNGAIPKLDGIFVPVALANELAGDDRLVETLPFGLFSAAFNKIVPGMEPQQEFKITYFNEMAGSFMHPSRKAQIASCLPTPKGQKWSDFLNSLSQR